MKAFPRNPDEFGAALRELEPKLDELGSARIEGKLLRALEAHAARSKQSAPRWRTSRWRRPALWMGAAAVASLAVAVAGGYWLARRGTNQDSGGRGAVVAAIDASAAPEPVPYCLSGVGARSLVGRLGKPQQVLRLPEHALVRAGLGPHVRFSLAGPAYLRAELAGPGQHDLILDDGVLAVSYQGGAGRRMRVKTPHATVVVVGTIFAVEVREDRTAVWVEEGKVDIVSADGSSAPERVAAGQVLETGFVVHSPPTVLSQAGDRQRFISDHATSLQPPPRERQLLSVAGPQVGVRAKVGASLLGETPVWALLPPDAVDVSLEPAARPRPLSEKPAKQLPASTATATTGSQALAVLYRRAETCMRDGNRRCARRYLKRIVSDYGGRSDAQTARYDLARLEMRAGHSERAAQYLQALAAGSPSPLQQPARYQLCRILLDRHDPGTAECFKRFRADFPKSNHDREALASLAKVLHEKSGCRAAASSLRQYVERYPRTPFARTAQEYLRRCARK